MKKILFLMICLSLTIAVAASCQKAEKEARQDGKPNVITTLFPVYDFTKNIAGDKASVTLLLPPGVEPHSFEPKPADILRVGTAQVFVYTGRYMEPWIDEILKGVDNVTIRIVDASKGVTLIEGSSSRTKDDDHDHGHGKVDPHIWLDMTNAEKMVDNILDGLIRVDAVNSEYYRKNAEAYKAKLREMDARYRRAFANCKRHIFIHGGHFAFGYLAKRYNLQYVSAYHGSPDAEPTPRRLIELKNLLKRYNLHYIYFEELITPRVAEIISEETGAALLKLHGAHNITKEEMDRKITFLDIMEENLKNLKVGLECQ